jgi:outer membrane lipoprotein LolB
VTLRTVSVVKILLLAIFLIAGCANHGSLKTQKPSETPSWQGRLTVLIDSDNPIAPDNNKSFTATFELQGNPQWGDLTFFTPIGSVAATLHWTPEHATLRTPGENRSFANLDDLMVVLLGIHIPVTALFDWLIGRNTEIDGWQVELSQFDGGKIVAQRLTPSPAAKIRIVLDNQ